MRVRAIGFSVIIFFVLASATVWWFWPGFTSPVIPEVTVAAEAEAMAPFQPYEITVPSSSPEHLDSERSPQQHYQLDSYWQPGSDLEYYRLVITRLADGRTSTLYRGDSHTMGWKWESNNLVQVDYDCGTGCMFRWVFKVTPQLFLAGREPTRPLKPMGDIVSYRAPAAFSPQGRYQGVSEYVGNEITGTSTFSLTVSEHDTGRLLIPIRADPRAVNWSWLDDERIELEYLCGKNCRATRVVRVEQK